MLKMKKSNQNKVGRFILSSLIAMIVLLLISNWLLKTLTLKEYLPYYFVCVKLPFSVFYIFYPFLFLFLFLIVIYFYPNKKISNKKYISISSVILCITLLTTIVLSGNVWVFNKDTISYNTLFEKNKVVYALDNIETAKMHIELESTRLRTTNLIYIFEMSDGEQIKIDANDSFRADDNKLIEFDKAIADKRECVGNFEFFENASDEFNEYFRSLF